MPRVSVRNSVRKPMSPRAGTRYSMRTQPVRWLTICSRRPLRSASSCVITPMYSSGRRSRAARRALELAVHLAGDDLRLADGKLEALASHQLYEYRELQLAAPLYLPGVRSFGGKHTERDVADELLVETILEHARGQATAISADERRGVDPDRHR